VRAEYLIGRLRARADRKLQAAYAQPTKYQDFAESCSDEARFLTAVADEMERLMSEAADARRMLVRMEAGNAN
jgi:hypothetical protein